MIGPSATVRDPLTWAASREHATDWAPAAGAATVFVVPHPDDEVLLMGGLLARQLGAGAPVTVVAVTDGEAAYPGLAPEPLAGTRRREQAAALAHLAGASAARPPDIVRLGLPDGHVARAELQLVDALRATIGQAALIVAPWVRDHHPDHEAVGRAAALVAAERAAVLAAGLFWAWSHTLPASGLRRLTVAGCDGDKRRAALASHRSQLVGPDDATRPILTADDLVPLRWAHEYYFVGRP